MMRHPRWWRLRPRWNRSPVLDMVPEGQVWWQGQWHHGYWRASVRWNLRLQARVHMTPQPPRIACRRCPSLDPALGPVLGPERRAVAARVSGTLGICDGSAIDEASRSVKRFRLRKLLLGSTPHLSSGPALHED
jgi:hypothetical protein